ncbi:MAG: hypothetical protein J6B34_05880 [Clostridia bacterium]|nr:hypothetical protein [Clostridia bacterium]
MKKILLVISLIVLALAIVSCSRGEYDKDYVYDGESLIGLWQESERAENYYQTYEFSDTGKVVCTTYSYGIKLQDLEGDYRIEGKNTIVMTYAGGIINENKFSINEGDRLVIQTVDGVEAEELILVPFEPVYNLSNPVSGTWASCDDENEIFIYNEDFTGIVKNDKDEYSFTYAIKGKYIYMSYEFIEGFHQGISVAQFEIKDNILTLTGSTEDEKINLTFERQ